MDISHGASTVHVHPVCLSGEQTLDTVRALHQTVVSLRAALEQSHNELVQLRIKVRTSTDIHAYTDTIEKLSLENHILRQRVLASGQVPLEIYKELEGAESSMDDKLKKEQIESDITGTESTSEVVPERDSSEATAEEEDGHISSTETHNVFFVKTSKCNDEPVSMSSHPITQVEDSDGKEDVTDDQSSLPQENKNRVRDASSGEEKREVGAEDSPCRTKRSQLVPKSSQESDNDSEEVDDIELIFTTDETKELEELQEDLVSITDVDQWNASAMTCSGGNGFKSNAFARVEKGTQLDEQSSGLKLAGSTWAHSVLVETDISKCGVIDENESAVAAGAGPRRNTLPCPMPYRSLMVGVKSPVHGMKFSARSSRWNGEDFKRSPMRPILVESNQSPKRESEAQTDITALPLHWKSESHLAHKVSHQFTTLPSKFALPARESMYSRPSLKICERNQDARRVLLSDINFTSMVPELSRSADHLSTAGETPPPVTQPSSANLSSTLYRNYPRAFSYMKNPDLLGPVSPCPQLHRNCVRFFWSPCDCSPQSKWDQSHCYQCSHGSTQDPSESKRRHSLKPSTSFLDVYRPGQPVQRSLSVSSWQSEPASPTHCHLRSRTCSVPLAAGSGSSVILGTQPTNVPRIRLSSSPSGTRQFVAYPGLPKARSRVTFQDSCLGKPGRGGQSLPDLRAEYHDSGDSTDSLIDEAEEYLRRSIDSIVTGADCGRVAKKRQDRRYSDPDPIREVSAPKWAQPFLPKAPNDLKSDYVVKVITGEGRVTVGRVRYVGAVAGVSDPYVGVELARRSGDSDGTFRGRRYFDCDTGFASFVPFKKVVMAWRT